MFHTPQPSEIESENKAGKCPVDHSAFSKQKTAPTLEPTALPVEKDHTGTWHIRGFEEARFILRHTDTKQAGFNSEQMGDAPVLKNKPILFQEGKIHHQQRKQTARFFTPKTVSNDYRDFIETLADQLVSKLQRAKQADLSDMSQALAVPVAARVIGLNHSLLPGMANRLDEFFKQPLAKNSRSSLPNWPWLHILQELLNQKSLFLFYFFDVQPAINALKRKPGEDIISHLLSLNYSNPEILVECVTYAAAGMATTREFISIATWHFLEQPALRARYLAAPEEERFDMLHEILRLEPVIGHLYRRATNDIKLTSQGTEYLIPTGDLINLHIYAANADEQATGADPLTLQPDRTMPNDRIPKMLMSFGDGAHRCPGSFLSIQETDLFLLRLLAIETLEIKDLPSVTWNDLTAGYEVRKFQLVIK